MSAYVSIRQHTSPTTKACDCSQRTHGRRVAKETIRRYRRPMVVSSSGFSGENSSASRYTSIAPYIRIRQHTSAYVSIRQHTSVNIRQQASAYVSQQTSADVSIRQSAYVSRREHTWAYVNIREHTWAHISQHTSAYVSTREHASAYVSIRQERTRALPDTLR